MDTPTIIAFASILITTIGFGIAHGVRLGKMEIRMIDRIAAQDAAANLARCNGESTLHARINTVDAKCNLNTTHIATLRRVCDERHHKRSPPTESFIAHA